LPVDRRTNFSSEIVTAVDRWRILIEHPSENSIGLSFRHIW
jgi:hypothetical protein